MSLLKTAILQRTQMYLEVDIVEKAKLIAKKNGKSLAAYFREILKKEISLSGNSHLKKKHPKVIKLKTSETVYYSTNHNDIYDH